MFGRPRPLPVDKAPIEARIELWPDEPRGRATVVKNGKAHELEITAPHLRLILAFLSSIR
jgi:hypothetical protein